MEGPIPTPVPTPTPVPQEAKEREADGSFNHRLGSRQEGGWFINRSITVETAPCRASGDRL